MKFTEGTQGRVFVLRLEHGEIVHQEIEAFAEAHAIKVASVSILGGINKGSLLTVGPEEGDSERVIPVVHILADVHEAVGTGTLFPDEEGKILIHMHMACGRGASTITGCIRGGVIVWHIMEVVITEISGASGRRIKDSQTGFKLLNPDC